MHSVQGVGYGLEVQDIVIQYMARERALFLLQSIQTSSGTHPASYLMGNEDSFPGIMVPRSIKMAIHLHLMPGLRMSGAILPFLHTFSWHA